MKALTRYTLCRFLLRRQVDFHALLHFSTRSPNPCQNPCHPSSPNVLFSESTFTSTQESTIVVRFLACRPRLILNRLSLIVVTRQSLFFAHSIQSCRVFCVVCLCDPILWCCHQWQRPQSNPRPRRS